MQTRSMTRKGLSRASSLDARASSPARVASANAAPTEAQVEAPIEIVPMNQALVEHREGVEMIVHERERDVRPQEGMVVADRQVRSQQEMLTIMQAQVMVQAATNRESEARLKQAFAETEARLHATAQAVVRSHANEQGLETRRSLGEAIQRELVTAHTHAHEQAMQAAQERLSRFFAEINDKIQAQLVKAVNDVESQGTAYIEGVTTERLALLRIEAQADIEKRVQQALVGYSPARAQAAIEVGEASAQLQRQLMEIQAALPRQLAEIEKRCQDDAVANASAHAERIMAKAEGRITCRIEARLDDVENRADARIREAIIRAETHCNVLETRARESVDKALLELRATHSSHDRLVEGNCLADVERALEKKMEAFTNDFVAAKVKPVVQNLVGAAVQAYIKDYMAHELETIITRHFQAKEETYLRGIVASAAPKIIEQHLSASLEARVRSIIVDAAPEVMASHGTAKLSARLRSMIVDTVPEIVDAHLASNLTSRVREIVRDVASTIIEDQLAFKLPARVRAVMSEAGSTSGHVQLDSSL